MRNTPERKGGETRQEVRETVFTIHAKWIAIHGLIIPIAKTDMRLPIAKISLQSTYIESVAV